MEALDMQVRSGCNRSASSLIICLESPLEFAMHEDRKPIRAPQPPRLSPLDATPQHGVESTVVAGPGGAYIAPFDVPAGRGLNMTAKQYRSENMSFKLWINVADNWSLLQGPNGFNPQPIYSIAPDPASRTFGISGRWKAVSPPWQEAEAAGNHLETRDDDSGADGWIWTGDPHQEYWNTWYAIEFT